MDARKKCPKCGYEMELRAGVILVCPICKHTERLKEIYDGANLRVLDGREGFKWGEEEKVRNSDPTVIPPLGSPKLASQGEGR